MLVAVASTPSSCQRPFMSNYDNPYQASGYAATPNIGSETPPVSGMAIGSLVCGIISLVFSIPGCCCAPIWLLSGVLGLVGVVLGIFGMQECNRGKGGKGMAIAGLICGGAGLAISLLFFVLSLFGVVAGAINNAAQQNRFNNNF